MGCICVHPNLFNVWPLRKDGRVCKCTSTPDVRDASSLYTSGPQFSQQEGWGEEAHSWPDVKEQGSWTPALSLPDV